MTHKKREHVENATASNVELTTRGRTNHPRRRAGDKEIELREVEAAEVAASQGLTVAELYEVVAEMQADYEASLAALPPMSDALDDDIPF